MESNKVKNFEKIGLIIILIALYLCNVDIEPEIMRKIALGVAVFMFASSTLFFLQTYKQRRKEKNQNIWLKIKEYKLVRLLFLYGGIIAFVGSEFLTGKTKVIVSNIGAVTAFVAVYQILTAPEQ